MTIQYRMTDKEYVENGMKYIRYLEKHSKKLRRLRLFNYLVPLLALYYIVIIRNANIVFSENPAFYFISVFIVTALWTAVSYVLILVGRVYRRFKLAWDIRKQAKEGKNTGDLDTQTITLMDDYYEDANPQVVWKFNYSLVRTIYSDVGCTLICTDSMATIVPDKAFSNGAHKQHFLMLLTQKTGLGVTYSKQVQKLAAMWR